MNQVPPGCLWLLLLRMVTGLSPIEFCRCLSKFSFVHLVATIFQLAFIFLSIDYAACNIVKLPFGWLAAAARQLKCSSLDQPSLLSENPAPIRWTGFPMFSMPHHFLLKLIMMLLLHSFTLHTDGCFCPENLLVAVYPEGMSIPTSQSFLFSL